MKWFWLVVGFLVGVTTSILLKLSSFSMILSFAIGFITGLLTSFLGNLMWDIFQKRKAEPYMKITATKNGTEFHGYSTDPNSQKYLNKLTTSISSQP
jgi:putative flippase GtrA